MDVDVQTVTVGIMREEMFVDVQTVTVRIMREEMFSIGN